MKILLTGASGLLGYYLLPMLKVGNVVKTLQRHDADIVCDLAASTPDMGGEAFDLVIHAAGSHDESTAMGLNIEGTGHLLQALEQNPPRAFVYVSSWEVYSRDAGENVAEDHQTWASTKVGQSKAQGERMVRNWCDALGVKLTTLRPARMFGKGVSGEMKALFNDVVNSRYIHVRGNDARLSLVCAFDVAKAILMLYSVGGVYNLCDGPGARWIELAEAFSANCGAMKRQTFLPKQWAETAWKLLPWIPAVKASLSPETLARRSKSLTLSDGRVREVLPDWTPFPVLDVLRRECKDYPYVD